MSNKLVTKPLAIALGTAFAASLTGGSIASASENPFSMTELSSGYMVADAHEGKCGGAKTEAEGKCGEGMTEDAREMKEGKCGEGKCGEEMKTEEGKMKEAKCGEGKCGGAK